MHCLLKRVSREELVVGDGGPSEITLSTHCSVQSIIVCLVYSTARTAFSISIQHGYSTDTKVVVSVVLICLYIILLVVVALSLID